MDCPVCGSPASTTLFNVSAAEAAQHFVLREANADRHERLRAHISDLWSRPNCDLKRCDSCSFGFADPYVAGDAAFYQLAFERSGYPSNKWEFGRTLLALRAMGFSGDRILEIGAGPGLFLDKITAENFVPKSGVIALEYGERNITELRGKGYAAFQSDVRLTDLKPGFDAIFLFQVVEHMDNLKVLFDRLSMLVSSEGQIFIAVPNAIRIAFNEANGGLIDMPPNHIGRWSFTAFEALASEAGLAIVASEVEPFSIQDFIKTDIVHAYLRKAQTPGTLENWSRAARSRRFGKLLGAANVAVTAPSRISTWRRAAATPQLGAALWVQMTRRKPAIN